jgi:virginiamycin B lyase
MTAVAASFASTSLAASLAGVVRGPDNREFRSAFVKARDTRRNLTVAVLSDDAGRFRFDDLDAGKYEISAGAAGYRSETTAKVSLEDDGHETLAISLREEDVRWSDISIYQGMELFPLGLGRDQFFENCTSCHAFQREIAATTKRDIEAWHERVESERTTLPYALGHLTERDVELIAYYITQLFGPDSTIEKSPADRLGQDLALGYKETLRRFSGDSLNIVFVEYDVPPPGRFPVSAVPDNNDNVWIANGGASNQITRLQANQGSLADFSVPHAGAPGIRSLLPAPDGSIWFAEQATNRLGRLDSDSGEITEFSGSEGESMRTVRIDSNGIIWAGGRPLTRFDPKAGRFTSFDNVPAAFDVELDEHGSAWFTDPATNRLGKIDGQTLNVSQWELPIARSEPRNLVVAPDGMIWIAEFRSARLARFDPKTETFSEYALSGSDPTPAALEFDTDGYLWYSSFNTDTIVRFDPASGKSIQYPCPHSEMTIHEFHRDSAGRIWYGSAPNNTVGYFFLAKKGEEASSGK